LLHSARTTLLARVDAPGLSAEEVALLRTLVAQYNVIEEHWKELERDWEGWPSALVHGDFVIKNLRVRSDATGPALLVFDWEMAGWGVPATDLAQSVGKIASPDLDAYRAVLQQDAHRPDVRDIRRLASYGNLLRVLDKIFWETVIMDVDSYEFLLKPISTLRGYEPQLAAVLGAINWSRHD
jgi:thiamine kinase-like enzyme